MTTARPIKSVPIATAANAAGGRGEQCAERGQGHGEIDDEPDDEQAAPGGEPLGHRDGVPDGQARLDPAEGDERAGHDERVEHHLDGEHRLQRLAGSVLGLEELEVVPEHVAGQPDGERDQREEIEVGGEEAEGLPEQSPHAT